MCKPHKDERRATEERVSIERQLQDPVPTPAEVRDMLQRERNQDLQDAADEADAQWEQSDGCYEPPDEED